MNRMLSIEDLSRVTSVCGGSMVGVKAIDVTVTECTVSLVLVSYGVLSVGQSIEGKSYIT